MKLMPLRTEKSKWNHFTGQKMKATSVQAFLEVLHPSPMFKIDRDWERAFRKQTILLILLI